jgi:hypothetical protein
MANPTSHDEDTPTAGPSGATDQTRERVHKFDEEGGDQPQAKSERAVEQELRHIHEGDKADLDVQHKPRPH